MYMLLYVRTYIHTIPTYSIHSFPFRSTGAPRAPVARLPAVSKVAFPAAISVQQHGRARGMPKSPEKYMCNFFAGAARRQNSGGGCSISWKPPRF